MSKRALSHDNMDIPGVWKTAFRNAEEPFPRCRKASFMAQDMLFHSPEQPLQACWRAFFCTLGMLEPDDYTYFSDFYSRFSHVVTLFQ